MVIRGHPEDLGVLRAKALNIVWDFRPGADEVHGALQDLKQMGEFCNVGLAQARPTLVMRGSVPEVRVLPLYGASRTMCGIGR